MSTDFPETQASRWVLGLIGLGFLALLLNAGLLVLVMWKEDPVFWRNEGGYPVWLRDFVFDLFYPLLACQFFVMAAATLCQCFVLRLEGALKFGGLLAILLLWLFFGSVLTILVWNNVDNLWNGRDLHYHPA